MKKTFILLAVAIVAMISLAPRAHSIACEATTFLNGKCKSEVIEGKRYYYCGSVLAGEAPNCTIYVGE